MKKNSHLVTRDEPLVIEWRCLKCGRHGKASRTIFKDASSVFRAMMRNHDKQASNGLPRDPDCLFPRFDWARIA